MATAARRKHTTAAALIAVKNRTNLLADRLFGLIASMASAVSNDAMR